MKVVTDEPNLPGIPRHIQWPAETQEITPTGNLRTTVILATAMVRIQEGNNLSTPQRALMDNGAQCCLMTKSCARRLRLRQIRCHLPLRGVSGPAGILDRKVRIYIRPWFDCDFVIAVELFLIDDWEALHPPVDVQRVLPPMNGQLLADENFNTPARIDLLLGADVWAASMGTTIFRNNLGAMMQQSEFGFLALGRFTMTDQNAVFATVLSVMTGEGPSFENDYLLDAIKRFWSWEEVAETVPWTTEEHAVERLFAQTHYRNEQGRIFWRESPQDPLLEYWLTSVNFGLSSSLHCACRAMIQCGKDNAQQYPHAAKTIESDFYVDDGLFGSESVEVGKLLCREVDLVLKSAGFELRNWSSNSKDIEDLFESSSNAIVTLEMKDDTKVLGLNWIKSSDELAIRVNVNAKDPTSKRQLLSQFASLYDPNGFISPLIVTGKQIVQKLWKIQDQKWDTPIPTAIAQEWSAFYASLHLLQAFRIPRWISMKTGTTIELHGFADASKKAYGGNIYVRAIDEQGRFMTTLLTSKSKIAPLVGNPTIPRLELQAAVILSKMLKHTIETFVGNRIAAITANTPSKVWAHVRTEDNPADLISRGMKAQDLVTSDFWKHGPNWLQKDKSEWPKPKLKVTQEDKEAILNECEPQNVSVMLSCTPIGFKEWNLIDRFSDWSKIIRITAIVMRFAHNAQQKDPRNRTVGRALKAHETRNAAGYWIKCAQAVAYHVEIQCLKARDDQFPAKSKILPLNPRLDENDILVAGGRLRNAQIEQDRKCPFIVPPKSRVCQLIMQQAHKDTYHGGVQMMMAHIRTTYWIPTLRAQLKQIVSRCAPCTRHAKKTQDQLMADLPIERVTPSRPFLRCGVDMAGPFNVRLTDKIKLNTRARVLHDTELKGYIAIFVCLTTRAVHLEPVMAMTSDAFKAAYLRFVARRGRPQKMFSDHGTNFVGANRELNEAHESWEASELRQYVNAQGTRWKFITPAAPHEGGLWEAAVKSMKHHLRRVMGPHKYTFEGIATLLAGIEACLNSRPICAMSDDPNDMQALTPAHFIIGCPLTLPLPEAKCNMPEMTANKLYEFMRAQQDDFWKAWSADYLSSLMQRPKWKKTRENVKEGQMVLIKSELYPPTYWLMGRIIKIKKANDGLVRSATIRVQNGELERPIRKLCILPTDDDHLYQR
ncbi:uncharacterized protein LOC129571167 [Sitodiplosis mosellana]|uniref:uncharacterized protein LOC129571167 n=1 Tax=Sitodiplosis mosellana TaxID=263140 RepID=UPI0024445AEA|nr:uncharacterized protein LOC129571167 [Sitodiplosis mosellana]